MAGQRWPEDGSPAGFEEIILPLRAVLEAAYRLERKELADIPYNGLERGALHIVPPAEEALTAESLRYDDEDQGRDAAEVILGLAVQLGIEQGRRIFAQEIRDSFFFNDTWKTLADKDPELAIKLLSDALEGIKQRLPKDGKPR